MDVEASRAIRQAEVGASKIMIERTEECFDIKPKPPMAEFPEIAEAQALLDALVEEDRVREALGKQQHA
jgi:hypothetical protein